MRNKFSELVAQGVAPFHHEPIAGGVPEPLDTITRLYNIYWGAATDTHMSVTPEGRRIITGHFTANRDKWDMFKMSSVWGGIEWCQTGYCTLGTFFSAMHLCDQLSTHNGEVCVELVPCDPQAPCAYNCPSCCCTTESSIPQPIAMLGNVNVLESIFSTARNDRELINALNESSQVVGEQWFITNGKIGCPYNGTTYIVESGANTGTVIDDPEFRKLMDAEGLADVNLVQYNKYFRLESDAKDWKNMFKGWRENKIINRSFDERTPEDWVEQIKWMLSTFN